MRDIVRIENLFLIRSVFTIKLLMSRYYLLTIVIWMATRAMKDVAGFHKENTEIIMCHSILLGSRFMVGEMRRMFGCSFLSEKLMGCVQ